MLTNLTAHDIIIEPDDAAAKVLIYKKSGMVVRLRADNPQKFIMALDNGCPVFEPQAFSRIDPDVLPDTTTDVLVPMVVAQWLCERGIPDGWKLVQAIYVPDTGPDGVVRNEYGAIVGVRRLVRFYPSAT